MIGIIPYMLLGSYGTIRLKFYIYAIFGIFQYNLYAYDKYLGYINFVYVILWGCIFIKVILHIDQYDPSTTIAGFLMLSSMYFIGIIINRLLFTLMYIILGTFLIEKIIWAHDNIWFIFDTIYCLFMIGFIQHNNIL